MLFVTLHGGKPDQDPHKNNIHAYDGDGKKLTATVLNANQSVLLDELRGIYLRGECLYVVNANKDQNSVLCYRGSGTHYEYSSTLISHNDCPGVLHPFDLTFDNANHCYVSSQDTNVVTRLKLGPNGQTASAAPVAPAIAKNGKFLPGTFVASSVADLGGPTTAVPAPAGLAYTATGPKKHSVRGVLWVKDVLYVVDQPAGVVKIYDETGKFLGQSNEVETPVHLLAANGNLYVSGANEVLSARFPDPPGNFTLTAIPGVKIKNTSGVVFTKGGHFYVASRTEQEILKFDSNFKPVKFQCKLPDCPEFLLHV